MKTLEEIRSALWFKSDQGKFRLDERDWGNLVNALLAGGYVIVPKEPTEAMVNAGYEAWAQNTWPKHVERAYAAMVEFRPK